VLRLLHVCPSLTVPELDAQWSVQRGVDQQSEDTSQQHRSKARASRAAAPEGHLEIKRKWRDVSCRVARESLARGAEEHHGDSSAGT
jgi:hypothetical protein